MVLVIYVDPTRIGCFDGVVKKEISAMRATHKLATSRMYTLCGIRVEQIGDVWYRYDIDDGPPIIIGDDVTCWRCRVARPRVMP